MIKLYTPLVLIVALTAAGWLRADVLQEPPIIQAPPTVVIAVPIKQLQQLTGVINSMSIELEDARRERDEAKEQLFNHVGQCT